jgi:hypothetical protein
MRSEDPQIESKKKQLKMELILKDSDFKKNIRKLTELEMRSRDLKRKKTMLEVELAKIELDTKKTQGLQETLQIEIKKAKNNLNLLR